TQTGQPGPRTRRSPSGSMRSMPLRIRVCVWPPHTSMIVHGRVTVATISARRRRASCGSRYSSTYFIAPLLGRGLLQEAEDALCLLGIEPANGDAGVDDDVLAGPRIGHARQADAALDAGEL